MEGTSFQTSYMSTRVQENVTFPTKSPPVNFEGSSALIAPHEILVLELKRGLKFRVSSLILHKMINIIYQTSISNIRIKLNTFSVS